MISALRKKELPAEDSVFRKISGSVCPASVTAPAGVNGVTVQTDLNCNGMVTDLEVLESEV